MGEYSQSHTQAPLNSFKGTMFPAMKATSTEWRIRTLCGENDFLFMNVQTSAPVFISVPVIFFSPLWKCSFYSAHFSRCQIYVFTSFFFHRGRGGMSENRSWHVGCCIGFYLFIYFSRFWTTHQQLPRSVCIQLQSNRIFLLSVAISVHTLLPLSSNLPGWVFFCFECFLISAEASYHPITLAAMCLLG